MAKSSRGTTYTRRREIEQMFETDTFLSYDCLMQKYPGLSHMTIRRDIDYLVDKGVCIKELKGARSVKMLAACSHSTERNENIEGKRKIAARAISFMKPDTKIFLDAGEISVLIAEMIPDAGYHILTNGIEVAAKLVQKSNPIVELIGGLVSRTNVATVGKDAMRSMRYYGDAEMAFICPDGLSDDGKLMGDNIAESEIKASISMLSYPRFTIALIDSSKYHKDNGVKIATIRQMNTIISDTTLPESVMETKDNANVNFITA